MTAKPEVHLEINGGFFRIPTDSLIYNITVINEGGVQVVERIVEREKERQQPPVAVAPPAAAVASEDPFYRELCAATLTEVAALARQGATVLDAAGSTAVKQPAALTQLLQQARAAVRELQAKAAAPPAGNDPPQLDCSAEIAALVGKIQEAKNNCGQPAASPSPAPAVTAAPSTRSMYIFDLDVVFQTLYELCTNETVKTHITTARENRESYFDRQVWLEGINDKVANLEPDADNFFNVPMSDVCMALLAACNEKPIQNLLKKMDQSQASIFLDSMLPLEVPPVEEVATAEGAAPAATEAEPEATAPVGQGNDAMAGIFDELLTMVEALAGKVAEVVIPSGSQPAAAVDKMAIDRVMECLESLAQGVGGGGNGDTATPPAREHLLELETKAIATALRLHGRLQAKKIDPSLDWQQVAGRVDPEVRQQAGAITDGPSALAALAAAGIN